MISHTVALAVHVGGKVTIKWFHVTGDSLKGIDEIVRMLGEHRLKSLPPGSRVFIVWNSRGGE